MDLYDYAQRKDVHHDTKRVFNLAFGIGLSIAVVNLTLDMCAVLPIVRTAKVFSDVIDDFTLF